MYRIQAINKQGVCTVYRVGTMEERQATIAKLLASGNYHEAAISWEWLARGWSQW